MPSVATSWLRKNEPPGIVVAVEQQSSFVARPHVAASPLQLGNCCGAASLRIVEHDLVMPEARQKPSEHPNPGGQSFAQGISQLGKLAS
jgi:hypothetical protein